MIAAAVVRCVSVSEDIYCIQCSFIIGAVWDKEFLLRPRLDVLCHCLMTMSMQLWWQGNANVSEVKSATVPLYALRIPSWFWMHASIMTYPKSGERVMQLVRWFHRNPAVRYGTCLWANQQHCTRKRCVGGQAASGLTYSIKWLLSEICSSSTVSWIFD